MHAGQGSVRPLLAKYPERRIATCRRAVPSRIADCCVYRALSPSLILHANVCPAGYGMDEGVRAATGRTRAHIAYMRIWSITVQTTYYFYSDICSKTSNRAYLLMSSVVSLVSDNTDALTMCEIYTYMIMCCHTLNQ